MRFYSKETPNVDDIVMCHVDRIQDFCIYVKLLEYDNMEGMVQLADASTRRKRKSVCLLKVNKKYPLLVIRVDKENKYIDLSNKFLSDEDKTIPLELNFDRTSHNGVLDLDNQYELSNLKSISDFIIEKKIEQVDLLKLNVEGAEYEILDNLISNNLLGKVKTLLIQFHLNQSIDYSKYKILKNKILKTHNCEFESIFVWEKFTLKTS